jgi:hypothetical protein
MNPRLAKIAPRLKCLLLMLSSDQPGEVFNAARAIGRALRSIGGDWHDLVAELLAPAKAKTSRNSNDTGADWHEMREFCLRHSTLLRSRELKFITGLADWRGDLTEKQYVWLSATYERLRRRHAA